jgi:hypothetical protein
MNNYHYIRGNLLQSRDPIGLQDPDAKALSASLVAKDVGNPVYDASGTRIGVKPPEGAIPHHLASISSQADNPRIANALAAAKIGINDAANGVFLPGDYTGHNSVGAVHRGNHPRLTAAVDARLDRIGLELEKGLISEVEAGRRTTEVLERARGALINADGHFINDPLIDWDERIRRANRVSVATYGEASRAGNDALREVARPSDQAHLGVTPRMRGGRIWRTLGRVLLFSLKAVPHVLAVWEFAQCTTDACRRGVIVENVAGAITMGASDIAIGLGRSVVFPPQGRSRASRVAYPGGLQGQPVTDHR